MLLVHIDGLRQRTAVDIVVAEPQTNGQRHSQVYAPGLGGGGVKQLVEGDVQLGVHRLERAVRPHLPAKSPIHYLQEKQAHATERSTRTPTSTLTHARLRACLEGPTTIT